MDKKILFALGAILLTTATAYLVFSKLHKNEDPHEVTIYPTRDDLQTCAVRKCFHSQWECANDKQCLDEAARLNEQFYANPKDFEKIFNNTKSSILNEYISCQKTCGVFDYLHRCADEDVYIVKCITDPNSQCQKDNKDYFDNFNTCKTRTYKACDGITDKEAHAKCFNQELIWCASDGLGEFKGYFNKAMYCV